MLLRCHYFPLQKLVICATIVSYFIAFRRSTDQTLALLLIIKLIATASNLPEVSGRRACALGHVHITMTTVISGTVVEVVETVTVTALAIPYLVWDTPRNTPTFEAQIPKSM